MLFGDPGNVPSFLFAKVTTLILRVAVGWTPQEAESVMDRSRQEVHWGRSWGQKGTDVGLREELSWEAGPPLTPPARQRRAPAERSQLVRGALCPSAMGPGLPWEAGTCSEQLTHRGGPSASLIPSQEGS